MTPRYLVYTMPGCPHCDRAKAHLDAKGVPYRIKLINEAEKRAAFKSRTGFPTFPQVFALDASGAPSRFVGGADALISETP